MVNRHKNVNSRREMLLSGRNGAVKFPRPYQRFIILLLLSMTTLLAAAPLHSNTLSSNLQQSLQPTLTHTPLYTPTPTPTPENPLITSSRASHLTELRSWQAYPTIVTGLTFSSNQIHLVSTGHDQLDGTSSAMRMWDLRSGQPAAVSFESVRPYAFGSFAHFSPDGEHVLANVGPIGIGLWNAEDGTRAARIGQGGIAAVLVEGYERNYIVVAAREDGLVGIWNVPIPIPTNLSDSERLGVPEEIIRDYEHETLWTAFEIGEPVSDVVYNPETRQVFILSQGGNLNIYTWEGLTGGTLQIVGQPDKSLVMRHEWGGPRIALRTGSSTIAYVGRDNDVVFYDYVENQTVAHYGWDAPIICVIYSPSGELLLIGDLTTLHVLDADSGASLATIDTGSTVSSCAFSPNGTLFATGSTDGEITIWGLAG